MNKNILIAIGVIAAILIGGGVYLSMQSNEQASSRQTQSPSKPESSAGNDAMMMEKDSDKMMSDDKMMSNDSMTMNDAMVKSGSYKDYSSATVSAEQQAGNKVVLFFHAPWCPFCKSANTAFLERTDEIPQGVTVLKTDYDSSDELKKKYGVTYQHTFVQIDSNGNMVTKWNGGDIDSLVKNIK